MTGHHRLAAPHRLDWVNQRGEPRPPLIRAPRWAIRIWARLDHARYVRRYGHAGSSDGRTWASLHSMRTSVAEGHGADGDRETVRTPGRPQLLWRRHGAVVDGERQTVRKAGG